MPEYSRRKQVRVRISASLPHVSLEESIASVMTKVSKEHFELEKDLGKSGNGQMIPSR